jgi:hypothetical protein
MTSRFIISCLMQKPNSTGVHVSSADDRCVYPSLLEAKAAAASFMSLAINGGYSVNGCIVLEITETEVIKHKL